MASLLSPTHLACCAVVVACIFWAIRRRTRPPYPPGPRGVPLLGNLTLPEEPAFATYRKWGIDYGSDIIRVNTLGTNIIVLNSLEATSDLLDKRSTIYSDRPVSGLTMLLELCGMAWTFALMPYGAAWRDGRKLFQREFHAKAVQAYRPTELQQTHALLRRLLHTPGELTKHIKQLACAEIVSVTYGVEVKDEDDPWVRIAENAMEAIRACLHPGAYLVDLIPLLKYVPEWVPGAGFQTQARTWKQASATLFNKPYDTILAQLKDDPSEVPDCVAKGLILNTINDTKDPEYMEWIAKSVSATMYIGGSDTVYAALSWFFLAMTLYPDIQQRAQASIDHVCSGSLPDFSHYDALPFVHALVKETLRWQPIMPLNPPRRCMEDDIYRGYLIPRGSIVFVNSWAILHDPSAYTSPSVFDPMRFLKRTGPSPHDVVLNPATCDPTAAAFGYGRRVCPGQWMAYESMWITIASVLAVYDIAPPRDAQGRAVLPEVHAEPGFTAHPKPFECVITPRSIAHEALIKETTPAD